MKPSAIFSTILAAGLFTASVFAQDAGNATASGNTTPTVFTHGLYPAPDLSLPVVANLTSTDPQAEKAKPAADAAKAAAGWMMVEYSGNIAGYAPMNAAHKDLSIIAGTPIRAAADASAATLGTAAATPPTMIVLAQGDWAQVNYPGPATLYFMTPQAPVAPKPEAAAPAPAPAPVTPAPAPVASAPVPQAAAVAATSAAEPTATPMPRYYYGVLKQRTNPTIPGPATAQYILTAANGQLLALLDLNKVSLARPITAYLNQTIKVYGVPQSTPTFPYVLINVQLLQAN